MAIYKDVLGTIGCTPVVRINKMAPEGCAEVYMKLEGRNPGGSIKDRTAYGMILDAEDRGLLKPGDTIVEPTSGNTGIGLAMIAVCRGYKMVLTMPEDMSFERRALLEHLGAEIVLSPGEMGMSGSIEVAESLVRKHGWFMVRQFENPANPAIHERTTALEIIEDFSQAGPDGRQGLDWLVCAVGTGGTLSGNSHVLKKKWPTMKTAAVEPAGSPVLSGGKRGMHGIQGIGAGFVPKNYDASAADCILACTEEEAYCFARRAAREEGMLVGISSGAVLWAALKLAAKAGPGKRVLGILPDGAEHYLSTPLVLTRKRIL